MNRTVYLGARKSLLSGAQSRKRLASAQAGSQLLEFALALPFLLVFVVGILDFGQVYNLKQKLNNAAREAARFAANENSGPNNLTVNGSSDAAAVRDVVTNYLTNAGVTQCVPATNPTVSVFVYTFSSSSSGCGSFSLVINRAYPIIVGTTTAIGTDVTLTYPYAWSIGRIANLLGGGSALSLPATITTDAVMQNIN
jgi:Flp pilus assembly protein TadG